MFNLLQQKSKVAKAFLDGEFERGGTLKLDLQSLREFLDGTIEVHRLVSGSPTAPWERLVRKMSMAIVPSCDERPTG